MQRYGFVLALLIVLGSCKVGVKELSGNKIKDRRDGEVYGVVKIGNQLWMSENMRYAMEGSYLNPDNPRKAYGRLYTWEQALKVCPSGWHLPSDEEWKELEHHLGMSEEDVSKYGYRGNIVGKLKSVSGWEEYEGKSGNGSNSSGFNALPAGYYWSGSFGYLGKYAGFWSSIEKSSDYAWRRDLGYKGGEVGRRGSDKSNGYSCRCLKS